MMGMDLAKGGDRTTVQFNGLLIDVDNALGHAVVNHGGQALTWEQLQEIKNLLWGRAARAIEVYPAQSDVVNNAPCRHLWRLGDHDFCPDLLGRDDHADNLAARHAVAWAEART